ncbi:hypothetical protein HELRODRAFT_182297 [Helobdella robusta]|uniref:Uncharacterized protein n=1 Tax=Helobdella robusta TaxID=6412 RepID=T1FI11_HELRO|nr:hypothetical protein HELRODRAFT_182297 [Helobdella robusta]ESN91055.1 hypothetical protein HELRODRAFT_182297 [Helobdella robusta]
MTKVGVLELGDKRKRKIPKLQSDAEDLLQYVEMVQEKKFFPKLPACVAANFNFSSDSPDNDATNQKVVKNDNLKEIYSLIYSLNKHIKNLLVELTKTKKNNVNLLKIKSVIRVLKSLLDIPSVDNVAQDDWKNISYKRRKEDGLVNRVENSPPLYSVITAQKPDFNVGTVENDEILPAKPDFKKKETAFS